MSNQLHSAILEKLDDGDDAALWQLVWETAISGIELVDGVTIEIGRCSHWLRPNKSRWRADGGFAWPTGYGGRGYSLLGLPLFDWSVVLLWDGQNWTLTEHAKDSWLRVAVPSRTNRHQQAAIHTIEMPDEERMRLYGFRRKQDGWRRTADSREARDKSQDRRVARAKERRQASTRRKARLEPELFDSSG